MKDYTIYEDQNQIIKINGAFHKFLKAQAVEDFYLSTDELDIVLRYAFQKIKEMKITLTEPHTIKNIPLIKPFLYTNFEEPLDIFNDAVHYLENYTSLDDDCEGGTAEIERKINQFLNKNNIYCGIFPKKIFDIKGFLIHKGKEYDWLIFFGFQENII